MDEAVYESPRLVPRERPGWALLDQVAEQEGWELIADNVGEGYARYSRERSWRVREDLFVHMVHDNLSEHCGVTVTSTDRRGMEAFAGRLADRLEPFSREELMAPIRPIPDRSERMRAVMRLALAAPEEFDQEIYDRVVETASDPEPGVRDAAIWVSAYVAWPPMRRLLRRVADEDTNEEVRRDAENMLRMYDNAGVPEA